MGQPVLVPGEYKIREVTAESVDQPFMFTGNAPGLSCWGCQEHDVSETVQFLVQMVKPGVGDKPCPEVTVAQVFVG